MPFLRTSVRRAAVSSALAAGLLMTSQALAADYRAGGKLLLTNGISTIEGASGGGLTPWAVIAGNETRDGLGLQGAATYAVLKDYEFRSFNVAAGVHDRLEFSFARQSFDTNKVGERLGLGRDFKFDQDVYGLKAKILGDAVYGSAVLPAVAIGLEYKKSLDPGIVKALGARHRSGTDLYVSATKLVLSRSLLVNATARLTKANQNGLLGFGGDRHTAYRLQAEASVAWQISRRLVVGGESRTKPDNLRVAKESDWVDLFTAWAVNRNLTATLAYTDLGTIATFKGQRGVLAQLQLAL